MVAVGERVVATVEKGVEAAVGAGVTATDGAAVAATIGEVVTTTAGKEVAATVGAGVVAVVGAGVTAAVGGGERGSLPAAGGKVALGESVATTTSGDGVNGATGGPISKTWLECRGSRTGDIAHVGKRRKNGRGKRLPENIILAVRGNKAVNTVVSGRHGKILNLVFKAVLFRAYASDAV